MKKQINYYDTPSNKAFNEVLTNAIKIWKTYDDTYGYATEKIDSLKGLKNISDNMMTIIAMFDEHNQMKLVKMLSSETKKEVSDRLVTGGVRAVCEAI